MLPVEWPLARLVVSSRCIGQFLRAIISRRIAEYCLAGENYMQLDARLASTIIEDIRNAWRPVTTLRSQVYD